MNHFVPSDRYKRIKTIDAHTAGDLGLECTPDYFSELVDKGRRIKNAIMASNKITPGDDIVINSIIIINTRFTGKIAGHTMVDHYRAIIPEVTGNAHITGIHEFLIDPDDSLNQGFILR